MTITELEETIRANFPTARAGKKNGGKKNGGKRKRGKKKKESKLVSKSYRNPILSVMRLTLIYQVEQHYRISGDDARARLAAGEDVNGFLAQTAEAAAERVRAAGQRRPGNAAYLARMGLCIAFPGRFHQAGSKGGIASVPDSYAPLDRELARQYENHKPNTRRSQRTNLKAFARAMWSAGWKTPKQIPTDRARVLVALEKAGVVGGYAQNGVNTYNRAAKGLNDLGWTFPIVSQRVDSRLMGLRTLPAEAFNGRFGDLTQQRTEELLPVITPSIGRAFDSYACSDVGRNEKRSLLRGKRLALGRVVATLWRHKELLSNARLPAQFPRAMPVPRTLEDVHLVHLYLLEVPVEVLVADGVADATVDADWQLHQLGIAPTEHVYVPLIRVLIDAIAAEDAGARNARALSDQPYRPSVVSTLNAVTRVLRQTLPDAARHPELRTVRSHAEHVHTELYRHVAATNAQAVGAGRAKATTKQKAKLISVLTLPHLVCIGLPRLADEVRRLEAAYHATARHVRDIRGACEKHPAVVGAKRTWHDALEAYVMLAVFTADPMRLSNLANARVGTSDRNEFRLDVSFDAADQPVRINGVTSRFVSERGDNLEAKTKQHEKERIWRWAPAIVDMDLLLSYIMEPRRERIVDRKLLSTSAKVPVTLETYSLARELEGGKLALFISPSNPFSPTPALAYAGAYAGASGISRVVGEAMHHVATAILGHRHVPPFVECGGDWAALFTGHNVRLLWSTYFFGLRENDPIRIRDDELRFTSGRTIAMDATSDDEKTLRTEYTAVSAAMLDRLRDPATEWTHPHAHNALMDRVYQLARIDWESESVRVPPHLQIPAAERASMSLSRRPQIRRARAKL